MPLPTVPAWDAEPRATACAASQIQRSHAPKAADGLCDENAVRKIVRDGPERVRELISLGLEFSRDKNGAFDLGREGGHSARRILHVKDMTGAAIEVGNRRPEVT